MSEVSEIERDEEEKLARIEEDAAEGDDDDDGSSGSSVCPQPAYHQMPLFRLAHRYSSQNSFSETHEIVIIICRMTAWEQIPSLSG